MKSRIYFIYYILLIVFFSFLVRGAWLQFFSDTRLITAKKKNFEKIIKLKPRRGTIYDRYGRELAISITSYSLFADPSMIHSPYSVAIKLSRLLKQSFKDIYNKIKNKERRFVWLKRHILDSKINQIRSWHIDGLAFLEEPKRVYPNDSLLAQTLGFVGHDGYGLEGLELSYNLELSGEEKHVLVQKDAKGRPFLFSSTRIDPITLRANGADIYLTIDSELQFFLEKELKKSVKKFSAHSALGLILNPETGEILAIANVPSFNLNDPFHVPKRLFRNRVVTDAFEPGSTLKPFVAAAALKKNIPLTKKYSNQRGALVIDGHVIHEAETHKDQNEIKTMDIREILTHSSNIGAAQIALDIGDNFLYQSLTEFGFGSKLGLKFPSESQGILNLPPWKKHQLATIGFGHSIAVTPLQLAMAFSVIANGGVLKKPYLVKSIHYKESGKKEVFKPVSLKVVLSKEQAKSITVMLISAMSDQGTGSRARVKGFLAAGKTGTAQIVSEKGGYLPNQYIASFAGFIPAQNPSFVIYLAIKDPKKYFYGSIVAAPTFANIAKYAVREAGLSPVLMSEKNVLRSKLNQKKKSLTSFEKAGGSKSTDPYMPDFIGLSLRSVYQKAREMQIDLKVRGSGKVVRTIPIAGEALNPHHPVQIFMQN